MNHSCDHNTNFYSDPYGFMIFEANRNIRKGEEITDNYFQNAKIDVRKYDARQKYLYDHYGFICKCSKCCKESTESYKKYETI